MIVTYANVMLGVTKKNEGIWDTFRSWNPQYLEIIWICMYARVHVIYLCIMLDEWWKHRREENVKDDSQVF